MFEVSDGLEYEGKFMDGFPDGLGMYKYPDGKEYIGQVKKSKWEGFGMLKSGE